LAKNIYDYTVRLDRLSCMSIANETGPVEKPENPISYLLVGVLSCIAITAKQVLEKMRVEFEAVSVNGLLYMVDDKVRYSDRIECSMTVEGGPCQTEEAKERLAEIVKKHCSVSVTIAKNPSIKLKVV